MGGKEREKMIEIRQDIMGWDGIVWDWMGWGGTG